MPQDRRQGVHLKHIDGPQGVRGRNLDNNLCREVLGWEPPTRLEEGLVPTYKWIEQQVMNKRQLAARPATAVGAADAATKAKKRATT